jgi:hypothetical protein
MRPGLEGATFFLQVEAGHARKVFSSIHLLFSSSLLHNCYLFVFEGYASGKRTDSLIISEAKKRNEARQAEGTIYSFHFFEVCFICLTSVLSFWQLSLTLQKVQETTEIAVERTKVRVYFPFIFTCLNSFCKM